MTSSHRIRALLLIRISAAIAAAGMLIVTVVIAPSTPAASAREARTAVFVTVTTAPTGDSIEIATRSGVITLEIEKKTQLVTKKKHNKRNGKLELSHIEAGMTVAGYYTESDDGPVRRKTDVCHSRAEKDLRARNRCGRRSDR
jgi:Rieske Fe-S protein